MLREKEEVLVQRALERIARARALGKTNVKLSQAEIDALERAERNQPQPAAVPQAAPKSKKAGPAKIRVAAEHKKGHKSDQSASNSPKVKAVEPRRRGRSGNGAREEALVPYPLPPEESYGAASGALMYPPPGYYERPAAPRQPSGRSRPTSRTNSTQSLRQPLPPNVPPPLPYHQHPYLQGRYYSNPDSMYAARPSSHASRAARPDPSEPDWEPRAQSSSSLLSFPIDQLPNLTQTAKAPRFDPSDPRFASPSSRRGPPSAYATPPYRHPADELFLPSATEHDGPARYGGYPTSTTTTTDDDDDESGESQGVQVEVVERSGDEYAIQTRARAAAAPSKGGAKAKGSAGAARRKGR